MKLYRSLVSSVIVAIAVVTTAAGCSQDTPETPDRNAAFAQDLRDAIDEAKSAGASDSQLAVLNAAIDSGEITLEDTRAAARAAVACMADNGVVAEVVEDTSNAGFIYPSYRAQIDDSQPALEATVTDCDKQELWWVGKMYSLQPTSQEKLDAYVETRLPLLRACLNDNSVAVDESTPKAKLFQVASQLMFDTNGAVDCFTEAGIDAA